MSNFNRSGITEAPVENLIYSPQHAATLYTQWARMRSSGKGLKWGIPAVDKIILPGIPGDLIVLLARPGHGKSSVACYLSKTEANRIKREGNPEKEMVVYVAVDQAVEEMETFFQVSSEYSLAQLVWGKVPPEKIEQKSLERVNLPIWLLGESIGEDRRAPKLSIDNIFAALESVRSRYGKQPTLVVIDYIQIVAVENFRDRVGQVSEAVNQSKYLARHLRCPVLLCCQASREVDKYSGEHFAGLNDGQWTSTLEQAPDKVIALWRPILTNRLDMKANKPIKVNGVPYDINEQLLLMRLLKQRMYIGYKTWALQFSPEYVHMAEMELINQSPVMRKFEEMADDRGAEKQDATDMAVQDEEPQEGTGDENSPLG